MNVPEIDFSRIDKLGICHLVLVAGHSTTAYTIGFSVAALADHPEARDYIRALEYLHVRLHPRAAG